MSKLKSIFLGISLLCGMVFFIYTAHASGKREGKPEEESTANTIKILPKLLEDRKIDVITIPGRPDSYSIGVMLCPKSLQESSIQWSKKIQGIYDNANLPLQYIDEGKFWQIPHITICIFKSVKLANIEKFQGIFQALDSESVKFQAASFEFMGRGDTLVAMPDSSAVDEIKELNALTLNYIENSKLFPLDQKTYQIDRNTKKGKLKPHMSLNTSVGYPHRKKVTANLLKNISSLNLDLNHVVITATNEW